MLKLGNRTSHVQDAATTTGQVREGNSTPLITRTIQPPPPSPELLDQDEYHLVKALPSAHKNRSTADKLSQEQLDALRELGMEWA
ncbi:hypothetical protein ACWFRK_22855 [Streptomyces sp. NPDC055157]